jgi:hypothetical protein
MKNFIKENWFKLIVVVSVFAYIFILFLGFCLKAKEYNFGVYKDEYKWCADTFGSENDRFSLCQKSLDRYYFNNKFFIDNKSQKLFEREKAFWNCYGAEWDKGNYNKEEDSKYCSAEADKLLK